MDSKPIYADALWQDLEDARRKYRRAYDRGYSLSARGFDNEAQRILDAANAALDKATANYHAARAANPVPEWAKEGAA